MNAAELTAIIAGTAAASTAFAKLMYDSPTRSWKALVRELQERMRVVEDKTGRLEERVGERDNTIGDLHITIGRRDEALQHSNGVIARLRSYVELLQQMLVGAGIAPPAPVGDVGEELAPDRRTPVVADEDNPFIDTKE